MSSSSISNKRKEFLEVLTSQEEWNPTAAAKKVGYKNPAASASQIMNDPKFLKTLRKVMDQRLNNLGVPNLKEEILDMLRSIAFFNEQDLYKNGKLIPYHKLPPKLAMCIKHPNVVHSKSGTYVTYRPIIYDRMQALDMLAKHAGFFLPEQHEHKHTITIDPSIFEYSKPTNSRIQERLENPALIVEKPKEEPRPNYTLKELLYGEEED